MAKAARRGDAPRPFPVGLTLGIVAGVLAIGLIAGLSYYRYLERPCTPTGIHEHAAFAVFLEGQEAVWTGPRWNYGAGGAGSLAGHIHQPNSHTIHMESGTDCITLKSFFATTLQSTLTTSLLELDDVDHAGRSVVDGEGGELRFYLGSPVNWTFEGDREYQTSSEVTWAEAPDLPNHQPRDGEYLLITFSSKTGAELDAEVAQQQRSIPTQIRAE